MNRDSDKISIKWSIDSNKELSKTDSIFVEPVKDFSEFDREVIDESIKHENTEVEIEAVNTITTSLSVKDSDVEELLNNTQNDICIMLSKLQRLKENFKNNTVLAEEKSQELKTSINVKQGVIGTYNEVLENIKEKVIPVYRENSHNKNIANDIVHTVSEIIENINKEIVEAKSIIIEISDSN